MRPILPAACLRYLDFIGVLEDTTAGRHDLDKIGRPVHDESQRSWRGFNLFLKEDRSVILAILRGEFVLNGLSNARLRTLLPDKSSSAIARILRRLCPHDLLKKWAMVIAIISPTSVKGSSSPPANSSRCHRPHLQPQLTRKP